MQKTLLRSGAVLVATVVALSSVGTATAAEKRATRHPYAVQLQAALDDLRELGVVGAQGQVSVGARETIARSGSAVLGSGRPMPFGGHFRIGSTTKTFVSVAVLQLVGDGRLSLDDPVERWLPGVVSGNGNDGTRVTVRHLLQQTSGLYNYTGDLTALASAEGYEQHRFDHFEPSDLVALAMRHAPAFAPGTRWDYSNTNYLLAGMVVERVTGKPWAEHVRSRILRPLGMRDTSYPADHPALPRPYALAYHQFQPGGPLVDVTLFNATAADAAGGMVSTTGDIARFWRGLQRGELLRPRQLAQLRQTVLADTFQEFYPGLRYGLGIFWVPNECGGYWGHPGDVLGTSTVNAVDESGDRAAVLYRTTALADPATGAAIDARAFRLLDEVMCAT
jgi:D-alanyl-D-alanine carboxypeptidase